jgi:hypothetical protein
MPKNYHISSCDESPDYRYRLDVSTDIDCQKRLAVIQLNPSKANATHSDPTIGKVSYWACEHEFGHVAFINLFALRSPDPSKLIGQSYDILVGPRNVVLTKSALSDADTIIFAWGRLHSSIMPHYRQRLNALRAILGDRQVYAVGAAVAGIFPRHGRMWNSNNRQIRDYDWPSETPNTVLNPTPTAL